MLAETTTCCGTGGAGGGTAKAGCATVKSTVNGTSPETPLASSRDIGIVASCSLMTPTSEPQLPGQRSTVSMTRKCSVGVTVIEPFGLRMNVAVTSRRMRASSAGLGVAPTEHVVCVLPTPPARFPARSRSS